MQRTLVEGARHCERTFVKTRSAVGLHGGSPREREQAPAGALEGDQGSRGPACYRSFQAAACFPSESAVWCCQTEYKTTSTGWPGPQRRPGHHVTGPPLDLDI